MYNLWLAVTSGLQMFVCYFFFIQQNEQMLLSICLFCFVCFLLFSYLLFLAFDMCFFIFIFSSSYNSSPYIIKRTGHFPPTLLIFIWFSKCLFFSSFLYHLIGCNPGLFVIFTFYRCPKISKVTFVWISLFSFFSPSFALIVNHQKHCKHPPPSSQLVIGSWY